MPTISKQEMIDKVISQFVFKTLPTISGDPEYESFNETIQALYANAAKFLTTLNSGKHGHVFLITKEALYFKLKMGTPW